MDKIDITTNQGIRAQLKSQRDNKYINSPVRQLHLQEYFLQTSDRHVQHP